MIDISKEKLLSFHEAARMIPGISRENVCYATVRRWATSGVRGKKLETVRIGGRRLTSHAAVQRFIEELTNLDDSPPPPPPPPDAQCLDQSSIEFWL